MTLPLFVFLKRPAGSRFTAWLARAGQRPGVLLLFVIPLWFSEALPGLGDINVSAYSLLFIAGYFLLAGPRFQESLDRSWRWTLGLGGTALVTVAAVRLAGVAFADWSWQSILFDLLRYVATWAWILGLLGLGHRRLNRFHRALPTLNAISYPFYLLHQTVIVLLGYFVVRWDLPIFFKWLFIAVAALAVTLGLCELARRWSVTRWLLGMKARP